MDRHLPDDQLDRALLGFFSERRDELLATAPTAHLVAVRIAATVSPTAARRRQPVLVLLVLLIITVLAATAAVVASQLLERSSSPLIPTARGVFTPTGSMTEEREEPTATLLSDGRVLVVGGYGAGPLVEVWDPATEVFSPAGVLNQARLGHTATLLQDGRVLVVGGQGPGGDHLGSAEVWDPDQMTFSLTGSLAVARPGMTAERLPDGRVLVGPSASAEVWDPDTNTFSPAGSLAAGHHFGHGIVLSDGRIFGSSGPAGSPGQTRSMSTAIRLLDGRVLVAGGGACLDGARTADIGQTAGGCTITILATAEIWDPATNEFSPTGSMATGRARYAATLLLDGRVLVVGDWDGGDGRSAEVFELR